MPEIAERIKVAIVGGGCAGLTAAFELTQPELGGRYDVTVQQLGFRLGGKGASGRGAADRIEEHGLHLWMGYYENAFRLMRECYAELGRDPERCPIASFEQAFLPANENAATDWSPSGKWLLWNVEFPPLDGLPGDVPARSWSVADYLVRAAALVRTLFATLEERAATPTAPSDEAPAGDPARTLPDWVSKLASFGKLAGLGLAVEALRFLEGALAGIGSQSQSGLLSVIDGIYQIARRELTALVQKDDQLRRVWEIADITLATLRGAVQFRLALDPRGFDAIDQYDSRKWLLMNGASRASVDSAFIRGLYDLAFAYADGDPNRPSFSAGAALRGSLRAFFTYRGAFFWKMSSGMGDIVFAPLYEVLKRRGVRFEFFHRLESVQLNRPAPVRDNANFSRPSRWVRGLEFSVQAELVNPGEYSPLVPVKGLPCWPSEARYEQLANGAELRARGVDFEAPWEARICRRKVLEVGRDFDMVVLAVGLGAVPQLCKEILAQDDRWQAMVEHVRAVPTQAFQLWLSADRAELGRPGPPSNVSGFVEPFDTWADMTHVAKTEGHAVEPKSIAYFCNVLPRPPVPRAATAEAWAEWYAEQNEAVKRSAIQFLERDVAHLWPGAVEDGDFRWQLLATSTSADEANSATNGAASSAAFAGQFWTANVRPSDAYTQALPGTARYRISPLEGSYKNLTIAGDWTQCGLNMGCVEAAVMSGRLASHAISQHPPLEKIVGYDHP